MEHFDITLVFFNSRLHNTFLSIIKHLGKKHRICVWVAPYHKADRTKETNALFLEFCRELGATVVEKQKIKTKLLFITHITALNKEYLETEILTYIHCENKISIQAFCVTGPASGRALLEAGFKRHIVFDRKLYELLHKKCDRDLVESLELLEMGNIISSYPVFDNFDCDYLMAVPTGLSFETETSIYTFIKNLFKLVNKIDRSDSIVVKLHTARDYEPPFRTGRLFNLFNRKNFICETAGNIMIMLNNISGEFLIKNKYIRDAVSGAIYRKVLNRCSPLSQFTKHWNFGVELFMPGIKKGLITGRSSVVWFALTQKIPVFNCDREINYQKSKYLDVHYNHYGVPFSDSIFDFDKKNWEKVQPINGSFDLIKYIQSEVDACV